MGADGIAIVDKPSGWTSHDVVAKARRLLGIRRIGHAGTLDPDATGVLVLGVGRGTRLLRYIQDHPKGYEALIRFGIETSTLDASGEVTGTYDMSGLTDSQVQEAARGFVGEIDQVPPMVSAVKVGGRRLHELARAGIEVDRPPRRVRVTRFELMPSDEPLVWTATIECSSGTYVRSLAADLGRALGGGAHLRSLRRTYIGPFDAARARPIEAIEVLPLENAVEGMSRVVLEDGEVGRVQVGAMFEVERFAHVGDGPVAVCDRTGSLLAVYRQHPDGRRYKPEVVVTERSA
jgi:tRNA pseudouridine55 synthase